MPRIEVKSLFDLSHSTVTETLSNGVKLHLEDKSCKTCCELPFHADNCSVLKVSRNQLMGLLPKVIRETIFDKCSNGVFMIPVKRLSIYCYLLESPDLKINFEILGSNDNEETLFLNKYGKYIQKFTLEYDPAFHNDHWKTILCAASNIQCLNLVDVKLNDPLLEAIGEHCQQIKKIEGIRITSDVTLNSFQKLCYRNFETSGTSVKNGCCESLEYFDVTNTGDHFSFITRSVLYAIVSFLLGTLPNLKSFGYYFNTQKYLEEDDLIPVKSNFEKVDLHYCYEEFVSLLKIYYPNMKTLNIHGCDTNSLINLSKFFPDLEYLHTGTEVDDFPELYRIITTVLWSNMKHIDLVLENCEIELSNFAEHLPVIETLNIRECGLVTWNGKVSFQKLNRSLFCINHSQQISWVSSFASCIKELEIFINHDRRTYNELSTKFGKDCYKSFVSVLFPNLELLKLHDFEYDFNLIIDLIITLPALVKLNACPSFKSEEVNALKQYVKDNNYNCTISQNRYWSS